MAETEIKKIISIEASEGERSVKSLKKEISDLRDALLNVEQGGTEWEAIVKRLTQAQSELDSVTKAGKTSIDAAKDSIVGMEREYKALYDQYKLLTEEQRNSDFGKEMANSLNTLSEKLNTTKQGVGNFKDNIGHYTESVTKAFSQMGISVGALQKPMMLATNASKGLGTALKGLIANPVGAVIMAIVVAFKALHAITGKVKEAINKNEESQMRLKEAMANLQPIINAVSNAFDFLAKGLVKVIEVGAKAAAFLTRWATGGKEAQKVTVDLAKSQNDLILKTREYNVLNSQENIKVQQLREQAAATTDATEKADLLNQAMEMQRQIDERNLEIAKQKLHNLEVEASLTANDAAMNEALAQAKMDVANAEAAISQNSIRFQRQITTSRSAASSGVNKEREEVNKLLEDLKNEQKTELQLLEEKYNKEKKLLEKYHKDTSLLTEKYEKERTEIVKRQEEERNQIRQNFYQNSIDDAKKLQDALDEAQDRMDDVNELVGLGASLTDPNFDVTKEITDYVNNLDYLTDEEKKILLSDGKAWMNYADGVKKALAEAKKAVDENNAGLVAEEGNKVDDKLNKLAANQALEMAKKKSSGAGESELTDLEYGQLEQQKLLLEQELENFKGTEEQKIALETEYYNIVDELRQMDAEKEAEELKTKMEKRKQIFDGSIEAAEGVADILGTAGDAWEDYINKQVKAGKMSEQESEKQFKKVKALQIASATINMLSGITAAISGLFTTKSGPWDIALAAVQAATIAASGIANIIKIKNTELGGGGSESSPMTGIQTAPVIADTNPYTYTRAATTEQEDAQNQKPIYVSVTDINDAQNKVQVRDEESTF